MSNIDAGHDLTFRHIGLPYRIMLKLSGSAPFSGGPVAGADGVIRAVSAHSSAYLVPVNSDHTEYLLIDAGMDTAADSILQELRLQNLDASAIKAVLITHGHSDHVGGLRQFPDADVYVGAPDDGYVLGRQPSDGFVGKITGKQPKLAVQNPDKLSVVSDGQTLQIGATSIQVFAVPGHTRGSVAYLIGTLLFIGDAITFRSNGSGFDAPKPFSHDIPQSHASVVQLVKRLDEGNLVVTSVIPAHSNTGTLQALREFAQKVS